MSSECDFSIGHYREILAAAVESGYRFVGYDDAEALPPDQLSCILRHDVDYMPEWTVAMARIERELGITSTYFFQVCAKTYNLRESASYSAVRELAGMGHTLGLHFDLTWKPDTQWEEMAELCRQDKDVFRAITGIVACEIISFHNPHRFVDSLLNHEVPGMRHTYEKRYFSDMKYLSDSQGWYEGCMCKIFAAKEYPRIQLLTHADYWPEKTRGDFISDTAQIVRLRSEELTRYLITFHPVCKKNEVRLRAEIRKAES
jgi:hypothetical protein